MSDLATESESINPYHLMKPIHVCHLIVALSLALGLPASGAMNVYLTLKLGGTEIQGEPVMQSIAADDVSEMIECFAVEHEMFAVTDSRGTSRPSHGAYKFVKRIDKATPLLAQAFAQQAVGDAVFRFYGHDRDSGETRRELTVSLQNAQVVSVRTWSPSTVDSATANAPPMEEIQLRYTGIDIQSSAGTSTSIAVP